MMAPALLRSGRKPKSSFLVLARRAAEVTGEAPALVPATDAATHLSAVSRGSSGPVHHSDWVHVEDLPTSVSLAPCRRNWARSSRPPQCKPSLPCMLTRQGFKHCCSLPRRPHRLLHLALWTPLLWPCLCSPRNPSSTWLSPAPGPLARISPLHLCGPQKRRLICLPRILAPPRPRRVSCLPALPQPAQGPPRSTVPPDRGGSATSQLRARRGLLRLPNQGGSAASQCQSRLHWARLGFLHSPDQGFLLPKEDQMSANAKPACTAHMPQE